jgi:hypothetical protein
MSLPSHRAISCTARQKARVDRLSALWRAAQKEWPLNSELVDVFAKLQVHQFV